jgi:predicted O-methyltransferase YrrM
VTTVSDEQVDAIVGAFWAPDVQVFRALLDASAATGPGDLAELGVLYGRSAVLIGSSLRGEETFTVVDLFEDEPDDAANATENAHSYPGLSRAAFEQNYLRVHGRLPVVVRGPSESVVDHVPAGSHRFVHVDASHLHEHVVRDIEAARRILRHDGVLVLDDIRSEHTPGVAAAAWQSVLTVGLRPFGISTNKLYATFGDPEPWRRVLLDLAATGAVAHEVQQVRGEPLVRVWQPRVAPVLRWRRWVPEVAWPAVSWAGGHARRASRRLRNRASS